MARTGISTRSVTFYNIYNDPDNKAVNKVLKFADATMLFNVGKREVMHFGFNNPDG